MDIDLEGERFFVRFEVYEEFNWRGSVTVTSLDDGEVLAVCLCGNDDWRFEPDVNKLIFSHYMLPGEEKRYADLMAKKIIQLFNNHRKRYAPSFGLKPLAEEVLVGAGIAADANDQLHARLGV